jgi:hypothetical protein
MDTATPTAIRDMSARRFRSAWRSDSTATVDIITAITAMGFMAGIGAAMVGTGADTVAGPTAATEADMEAAGVSCG